MLLFRNYFVSIPQELFKAARVDGAGFWRIYAQVLMIQSIEKKRPARCGLDVALHAVDVMTSLLKAGETGKVITLATTCERPKALKPKDALALLK